MKKETAIPNREYADRLELSIDLVRQAGALILKYLDSNSYSINYKPDESPVTDADLFTEDFIRKRLSSLCPYDSIEGEELGVQTGKSGYTWHIDPIDGTKSFIRGVPLFGTLAGLEYNSTAVAGVIFMPALREIVYAAQGYGAWWSYNVRPGKAMDARVAQVSGTTNISQSTVSTTDAQSIANSVSMLNLVREASLVRCWGDCYGHYLVATGKIDAMVDPLTMNSWDCAALLPIIKEAGGKFTSVQGEETIYGGSAISTNGKVHNEVLKLLNSNP